MIQTQGGGLKLGWWVRVRVVVKGVRESVPGVYNVCVCVCVCVCVVVCVAVRL